MSDSSLDHYSSLSFVPFVKKVQLVVVNLGARSLPNTIISVLTMHASNPAGNLLPTAPGPFSTLDFWLVSF